MTNLLKFFPLNSFTSRLNVKHDRYYIYFYLPWLICLHRRIHICHLFISFILLRRRTQHSFTYCIEKLKFSQHRCINISNDGKRKQWTKHNILLASNNNNSWSHFWFNLLSVINVYNINLSWQSGLKLFPFKDKLSPI